MIKLNENTGFTKSIIIEIGNFSLTLEVKTIAWIRMSIKWGYKLWHYSKKISSRKFRNKGKFSQYIKKTFRIFCFGISWTRVKTYSRRYVYSYFHKKKYRNTRPGFFERLKAELKLKGIG